MIRYNGKWFGSRWWRYAVPLPSPLAPSPPPFSFQSIFFFRRHFHRHYPSPLSFDDPDFKVPLKEDILNPISFLEAQTTKRTQCVLGIDPLPIPPPFTMRQNQNGCIHLTLCHELILFFAVHFQSTSLPLWCHSQCTRSMKGIHFALHHLICSITKHPEFRENAPILLFFTNPLTQRIVPHSIKCRDL